PDDDYSFCEILLEKSCLGTSDTSFKFVANNEFDLEKTVDGCCDLKVVTTGTLSSCGIPDELFQKEVDENNLKKFGPGHSYREDGKLIKPPGHQPPNIKGLLEELLRDNNDRNESFHNT